MNRKCREKNVITMEISRPIVLSNYDDQDYDFWTYVLYYNVKLAGLKKTSFQNVWNAYILSGINDTGVASFFFIS